MAGLSYALFLKGGLFGDKWSWASDGGIAGTTGESRITDAFQINGFDFPVEFRCHFEGYGWTHGWRPAAVNTWDTSVGKRLEAVTFRFPQGIPADKMVLGRAHVQGFGWTTIKILKI